MRSVLRRALVLGLIVDAVILVGSGLIGWAIADGEGVLSAVLATALAVVFTGATTASFLVGDAIGRSLPEGDPQRFTRLLIVVAATWGLKIAAFLVLLLWLRTQDWLSPAIFGVTAIVAVVASLVVDSVVMATSRVPIVPIPRFDGRDDSELGPRP